MMVMHEALERFSRGKPELTRDMGESSFALFHKGGTFGSYGNTWDRTENDGEDERKGWRSANYVEFMRYVKELFQLEAVVLEAADWEKVGKATVVDVRIPVHCAVAISWYRMLILLRLAALQAMMLSFWQSTSQI